MLSQRVARGLFQKSSVLRSSRFQVASKVVSSQQQRNVSRQTRFQLNTGASIPALGFGTFQDPDAQEEAVRRALELGFRHVDTAQIYDTEMSTGKAIRSSGVPREDIFLSTKLWMTYHHPEDVEAALDTSLRNLQTDYLDILMMHFPCAFARPHTSGDNVFPVEESTGLMAMGDTHYLDTWRTMEKLVKTGKVKAIGLSNFQKDQIQEIIDKCEIVPAIHQIELHPWLQQADFVKWHKEMGIHNTAYSPLGNSNPYYATQVWSRPEATSLPPPTEDPILIDIAKKYNKSPHQVAYAWGISNGRSVLSKSVIDWQIVANLEADFELDAEDMEKIATMDKKARFNDPSPLFRFQFFKGHDGFLDRGEHEYPVSDVYGKIGSGETR